MTRETKTLYESGSRKIFVQKDRDGGWSDTLWFQHGSRQVAMDKDKVKRALDALEGDA